MIIAAIDIGSNAARMQISRVLLDEGRITFKKIEYVRFALRLGQDVFNSGKIEYKREAQLKKLLTIYKMLMELHEVDDYLICATSALREAENGLNICERVQLELGMTIHLISGEKEAELINNVIIKVLDASKTYLHIDVGGGSTELNIYRNLKKITSQSFKIGSVRLLQNKVSGEVWKKIKQWVEENVPKNEEVISVGTGGNITKLFDLSDNKNVTSVTHAELVKARDHIETFTLEERINKLELNPDRADVITHASKIYLSCMEWAKSNEMIVPDLGLKDGIMMLVYEKQTSKA
jgi:exopolyphosphatase / guanosine-5'-triphosphate,3'-diphosphate pyrophosphatase